MKWPICYGWKRVLFYLGWRQSELVKLTELFGDPGETSLRGFVKLRLWHSALRAGVWYRSFSVTASASSPLVHNIHAVLGIRNCPWEALIWSLCDLTPSRKVLTGWGWRDVFLGESSELVWNKAPQQSLQCTRSTNSQSSKVSFPRSLLSSAQATEISTTCVKLLGENCGAETQSDHRTTEMMLRFCLKL